MNEPLNPEACGDCSACKKNGGDPWKCHRPWNVGKLLGPLDVWYDPDTGLKKSKGFNSKRAAGSDWFDKDGSFDMASGEKLSYKDQRERAFFGDSWDSKGNGKSHATTYERCAHSHPALVIPLADGTSVTIYGGAAGSPVHKDCDIYVELDAYSAGVLRPFPWEEQDGGKLVIKYPVTDMQAPKDPAGFKKMVKWIVEQLLVGKKVHIGCIGGHGRTGTLLAAIVKELTGNVDAISFVRQHYCKKAVESDSQSQFLAKEFGIKPEKGYKSYGGGKDSNGGKTPKVEPQSQIGKFNERFKDLFGGKEVTLPVEPIATKGNIWFTK
jgi:hypothetical protein